MNLCEIFKQMGRTANEDLVKLINQASLTLAKRGDGYEVVRGADETIEHKGLLLRKVDRKPETGDFVKFINVNSYLTKNGVLYEVFDGGYYRTSHKHASIHVDDWGDSIIYEVFEVVGRPQEKSANQQRHETIQRAKEFVEGKIDKYGVIFHSFKDGSNIGIIPEFHIKKNRVTCVLRGSRSKKVRYVGRAICSIGDVFNEWIGKAIALARALGIDIPQEFLDAVQPTEFAIGQSFKYNSDEVYEVTSIEGNKALVDNTDRYAMLMDFKDYKIIDDTNAIYKE